MASRFPGTLGAATPGARWVLWLVAASTLSPCHDVPLHIQKWAHLALGASRVAQGVSGPPSSCVWNPHLSYRLLSTIDPTKYLDWTIMKLSGSDYPSACSTQGKYQHVAPERRQLSVGKATPPLLRLFALCFAISQSGAEDSQAPVTSPTLPQPAPSRA